MACDSNLGSFLRALLTSDFVPVEISPIKSPFNSFFDDDDDSWRERIRRGQKGERNEKGIHKEKRGEEERRRERGKEASTRRKMDSPAEIFSFFCHRRVEKVKCGLPRVVEKKRVV
jgi:hypothetical protein